MVHYYTRTFNTTSHSFAPDSVCKYGIDVLDFHPPLDCSNVTKCEQDYPCEIRMFWIKIHFFVEVVRALLFYGTSTIIVF
ncbi:unnamed protein product, partial [Allacma fusca]